MTVCVAGVGGGSAWGRCLAKARFRVLTADLLAALPRFEAAGLSGANP